jgi:hypothetical protein
VLIPKKFTLGSRTYTVQMVRHTAPKGTMGKVYYDLGRIEIATNSGRNDRSFKQEEIDDTFWHEVTHAILRDMGHKLWNNERFVTDFANRLTQVVNTSKL